MKPRPVLLPVARVARPRWTPPPARPAAPAIDPAERERRARWLTMAECGDYLRYTDSPDPANAAWCWLKRHDVPHVKRGTSVLVRVGAVDDALEAQRKDVAGRAQALLRGRR
ncbi:MAG TPA: hypothetical protein VKE26_26235 [Xanthobacteraceae bacterium]|nr:hypothetical protein [Xanthobacteraceae bacterium]